MLVSRCPAARQLVPLAAIALAVGCQSPGGALRLAKKPADTLPAERPAMTDRVPVAKPKQDGLLPDDMPSVPAANRAPAGPSFSNRPIPVEGR